MELLSRGLQDLDPSFKYIPERQWNSSPVNARMLSGRSGQYVLYFWIRTNESVPDIYLYSVISTARASVEYTFKVSAGAVLSIVDMAYQLIRTKKQLWNPHPILIIALVDSQPEE